MSFVVVDADVASAILRGRSPDQLRARLAGQTICITFVTLSELTKWTNLRGWGPRFLAELLDWRMHVVLLPFDEAVALVWGDLLARAQRPGRPRPDNDTWIAASCLVHGLALATFNVKDFAGFGANEGLQLEDGGPGPIRPTR